MSMQTVERPNLGMDVCHEVAATMAQRREFGDVMVDAFESEAIDSYEIDFSRPGARVALVRASRRGVTRCPSAVAAGLPCTVGRSVVVRIVIVSLKPRIW
ncbi:MAG: hypothetical protein JXA58_06495 [Dehalococcoidia bacterium]|nr:hypothetical protein [Dehalococcoidia bacterium]